MARGCAAEALDGLEEARVGQQSTVALRHRGAMRGSGAAHLAAVRLDRTSPAGNDDNRCGRRPGEPPVSSRTESVAREWAAESLEGLGEARVGRQFTVALRHRGAMRGSGAAHLSSVRLDRTSPPGNDDNRCGRRQGIPPLASRTEQVAREWPAAFRDPHLTRASLA